MYFLVFIFLASCIKRFK